MIPAIILSAGKSSRMGRTKATMPLGGGHTFLSRIVTTLREAEVDDVVVVVGHDSEAVRRAAENACLDARLVLNPRYESGQLSSILAGLAAVDHPGVQAVLLTLVDVPLVSPPTVRAVLDRYRVERPAVVRPVSGARHGHPILLDRRLFALLRAADPAVGIKPIVRAFASAAGDVAVDDEGAFVDFDTPDEYARLTQKGPGC